MEKQYFLIYIAFVLSSFIVTLMIREGIFRDYNLMINKKTLKKLDDGHFLILYIKNNFFCNGRMHMIHFTEAPYVVTQILSVIFYIAAGIMLLFGENKLSKVIGFGFLIISILVGTFTYFTIISYMECINKLKEAGSDPITLTNQHGVRIKKELENPESHKKLLVINTYAYIYYSVLTIAMSIATIYCISD